MQVVLCGPLTVVVLVAAQDGPDLELGGGIAGLRRSTMKLVLLVLAHRVESRQITTKQKLPVLFRSTFRPEVRTVFVQVAAGAAINAVADLVAALLGGDVQQIGLGLVQMRLAHIAAIGWNRRWPPGCR